MPEARACVSHALDVKTLAIEMTGIIAKLSVIIAAPHAASAQLAGKFCHSFFFAVIGIGGVVWHLCIAIVTNALVWTTCASESIADV
tara:strand:+ start:2129 stop:2389 length:261 start_codon:yes stop_codon:yes gene_type:complete